MRRYARYNVIAVRHNADSASPFATMPPNRVFVFPATGLFRSVRYLAV